MTIYVDPYHTTSGVITDMSRTVTPLKECTVRDSLLGTNLGVHSHRDVTPVFITGCRDSEKAIPSFTHSILVKNFNGKSYLFTDMTLFVSSGGTLQTLDSHIRRREEFEFTKARAIATLAWAAGETSRFHSPMNFAGDVFAAWMGQSISRAFALDFMATNKVQMLALAYWESLFKDGPLILANDDDACMTVAQKASRLYRVPVSQAMQFYRSIETPMSGVSDFCTAVVKTLDNVNLNPVPGRPETGFNIRVLFNLIADAWYSTKSNEILAVAMEHPPTLCAIIYYCANYNNFRRQQLGQIIQNVARGGKGEGFMKSFAQMLEEFTAPERRVISVMEYLKPENYDPNESEVQALMARLTSDSDNGMSKEVDTMESGDFITSTSELWDSISSPGVSGTTDPERSGGGAGAPILNGNEMMDGRPVL